MAILIDILASGAVNAAGAPLASGKAYFYELGTTTKVTAYQDSDLTIPHANPLTLDAAGRAEAYVNDPIRMILEDADGNKIDDIESIGEVAALKGDVTIGTDSNNILIINSRIRGDLIPRTASTYKIGSANYPWQAMHLDGSATNGGAIYFNAETTKYIKANTAGTALEVGGFTSLVGPLIAPATTKMVFYQSSAPSGWTLDATLNQRFLMVASSGGGTTAGAWAVGNESSHTHMAGLFFGSSNTKFGIIGESAGTRSMHYTGISASSGTEASVGVTTISTDSHTHTHGYATHEYAVVRVAAKDALP